jgi:hypothetical protein
LTESLINLGRFALDMVAIASGIASGNILSVGMGVLDLGMMTFMNIKGVFENIDQIDKLEHK